MGAAPALVRTLAVWQNAQLTPTRETPQIVFFENPIGRSCPGSQIIPSAPYPPAGSLSANIRGRTCQIQYGMPSWSSLPIDPYLNCSSIGGRASWAFSRAHERQEQEDAASHDEAHGPSHVTAS